MIGQSLRENGLLPATSLRPLQAAKNGTSPSSTADKSVVLIGQLQTEVPPTARGHIDRQQFGVLLRAGGWTIR